MARGGARLTATSIDRTVQRAARSEDNLDPFENFKAMQKQGWAHFAPLEMMTTPTAANLVTFAGVKAGQQVLDVGCGTGVVAITAARAGAKVSALDLTPELLERARANSAIAEVAVEWREGDAEQLPYGDAAFDVVLSQFGHMFAPRPAVAIAEMLRVLKPGGTIAFSTWPPDLFIGRMFKQIGSYLPPPPPGISPPPQWGDQNIVRERLGSAVKDIVFERGTMRVPALSLQHFRGFTERTAGPLVRLVETLTVSDPAKLATFRREYDALAAEYLEDNTIKQEYMMTRAIKN
jgi:2-polyprenyl-3-methyl-5-hydroxy-6-metoxy-1,4-benzoquinol methylase